MTLPADRLGDLVRALVAQEYEVFAPTVRDGAIVHEPVTSDEALPRNVGDAQGPGRYRLTTRDDGALFGWRVGPQGWRHQLHPQRQLLLESRRTDDGFDVRMEPARERRLAFLGVRPCDVAAIAAQDRVLADGKVADPHYVARRRALLVVAVSCTEPGETCFCASMGAGPGTGPGVGAGPGAGPGFDLALTELVAEGGAPHRFVAEIGSEAGGALAGELGLEAAPAADVALARERVEAAAGRMGRALDREAARDLLARSAASPHWDDVARRCLSCTSCTLVCPTCYCTNVVDRTDLADDVAVRWRRWDSCHTMRHSYIHGGSVRASAAGRYRHWISHKLSTWEAQFGAPGCTGCGRCIAWCPAGIDLTAEVRALAAREGTP